MQNLLLSEFWDPQLGQKIAWAGMTNIKTMAVTKNKMLNFRLMTKPPFLLMLLKYKFLDII
jgi:hypothetical protein